MAYIGKGLVGVLSENKAVDTMSNPNGVLTTMTLSRTPGSVNNVEVYIDGVFQTPGDEFTLAGDVLTFTTAPETNAVVIAVVGNDSTIANVDNNSITGTMFPDGSVSDSKITDIVSTKISGTLPALDGSSLTNLTAGNLEGTLPALDGSTLTGVSGFRKNASDPLSNSNGNQGDVWVNTASGEVYVLTDATTNANVWTNVGEGTGDMPVPVSLATGGTLTTDGDYNVHTFTTSGQLIFTAADLPVEYLVIAGGGSGAGERGGGGGAGGYRTATGLGVTATSYSITVGAGGAGVVASTSSKTPGNSGSNSSFHTITSTGGGYGGHFVNSEAATDGDGGDGGSGGGAGATDGSGTPAGGSSTSYGNDGGTGGTGGDCGGGGGGSSAVGGNASYKSAAGAGGNGTASSITGSSVTRAGGGGGGVASSQTVGAGGSGGGTAGVAEGPVSSAATANTGSGSGGGDSGNGGSGVVIVRYKAR